jgi:Fe-S-cluster containining protein
MTQNPCLGCPGACCWQNLINLCGYDVWTIATNLHIRPTDFLAFAELSEESPYDFRLDSSEKAYCLALYMKKLPDGDRRCIFSLDLPNHQLRCGIYPFRPIACRAYPLAFLGEEVVVKPWAMCPEASWELSQLDIAYWQEELARHDMEFSIYALAVGSWNKEAMKQSKQEILDFRPFLNFLMDVYGRLDAIRGTVPAEAWPGIWKHWREFTAGGLNPLFLEMKETNDCPAIPACHSYENGLLSVRPEPVEGLGHGSTSSPRTATSSPRTPQHTYFPGNDNEGLTSWDWWLQGIHEAVAETSQNISVHNCGFKKSGGKILL